MRRIKNTSEKISQKVWREAVVIAKARTNARYAFAYAFNCNDKEITCGEFMYRVNGDEDRLKDFDGYIINLDLLTE